MEWFLNYVHIITICVIYQVSARSNGVRRHNLCEDVPLKTVKIKEDPDSCGKFIACIGQHAEHYKCFSDGVYGNGTVECLACDMEESIVNLDENATTTTKKKIIVKDMRATKSPSRKANGKTVKPKNVKNSQTATSPGSEVSDPEENDDTGDYDDATPGFDDNHEVTENYSEPEDFSTSTDENESTTISTETTSEFIVAESEIPDEITSNYQTSSADINKAPLTEISTTELSPETSQKSIELTKSVLESESTSGPENEISNHQNNSPVYSSQHPKTLSFSSSTEDDQNNQNNSTVPSIGPTTLGLTSSTESLPTTENELKQEENLKETEASKILTSTENTSEISSTIHSQNNDDENISENSFENISSQSETSSTHETTTSFNHSSLSDSTENFQSPTPKCNTCIETSSLIESSTDFPSDTTTFYEDKPNLTHFPSSNEDTTAESTIYPTHSTSESFVQDQFHHESTQISNQESSQHHTSSHHSPSPTSSEEIINERATSASIYESADSTSYSSVENHGTSQFSSESIMGGTASTEYNEEIFTSTSAETESTATTQHDEVTKDYYDEATVGTCFTFLDYNEGEDAELKESYTTPIIRFQKVHSESLHEESEDSSTSDEITSTSNYDVNTTEDSTQHIRTLPPDHYNPNDSNMQKPKNIEDHFHDGGVLSESALMDENHHSNNYEEVTSTTEESPLSEHHMRTLPPDHYNPNDHFISTISDEEKFLEAKESTEDTLHSSNFSESSDSHDETHKMHIFHTERPSHGESHHQTSTHIYSENDINNQPTSSDNSHDDIEHQSFSHSEQSQHELPENSPHNSEEYTTEIFVDRNENEMNAEPTSQKTSSNENNHAEGNNFDGDESKNNNRENSHESEISNTQSNSQINVVDNENKTNEDASDTSYNRNGEKTTIDEFLITPSYKERKTTKYMKKRKIKKSRPVTTTTTTQ